ncbi:MAG: pilus assembly protein TadG-related protein [Anaerolineales bacterium]
MKQMKQNRTYERGQAIILIVLAIIGMIAMVALAIDGGNVFLNRRSAQNAADSAALSGALAKAQAQNQSPAPTPEQIQTALQNAAISRAASNNFSNDGSNTVTVSNPPGAGCKETGPYAGDAQYLQVIIRTTIKTYFAPVIGITQLHNCVEAIARVMPGDPVSLCYGALICALSPTDSRALQTYGGANVTLEQGGGFSNSNDATESIYISNNSTITTNPTTIGLEAVGGINVPSGFQPPIHPFYRKQLSYPLPYFMIPIYTCDYTYNDLPNDLPGGNLTLVPGVYCITGKIDNAMYRNATSGGTGIGGVTIVMLNQGISWTGNTDIFLTAPPYCSPQPCISPPTAGLLIYLPYGNTNKWVKFAGNGTLTIIGTILAPDVGSTIQYNGNYSTGTFRSQLVAWNMQIGGSAVGSIIHPPIIYEYPGPPTITLVK